MKANKKLIKLKPLLTLQQIIVKPTFLHSLFFFIYFIFFLLLYYLEKKVHIYLIKSNFMCIIIIVIKQRVRKALKVKFGSANISLLSDPIKLFLGKNCVLEKYNKHKIMCLPCCCPLPPSCLRCPRGVV